MNKLYTVGKISDWHFEECYQIANIKLKPMQMAIINCNQQHDVLVNLPTGFGKSMLFQYPASKLSNQCIIIFVPLRALLWDSIKQAQKFGIQAAQINDECIKKYSKDKKILQMYFMTPEKLFINQSSRSFVETLHELNKIKKFVIDEAHCVSQWGSDFRPHYLQLTKLRMMFPGVNILAMSATIPPQAFQDLIFKLSMTKCIYFQASFNRPNLTYMIRQTGKSDIASSIKSFLAEENLLKQCGIIYCQTIKFAQQVSSQLGQQGLKCALFHSKISQKARWQIFKKFMNEQIKIIVATICFGMGVNKSNIRYVINAGISMTMENYYQQSGRAGRDGKPASCLLLSYTNDQSPIVFLTEKSVSDKKMRQRKILKIYKMKEYVKSLQCRKKFMFRQLGQKFTEQQCNQSCDYCLNRAIYQQKYQILKIDMTDDSKKILKQLEKNDKYFTKRQLAQYLKGKQIKRKGAYNVSIGSQIMGIFKSKADQQIEATINKLISLKLLTQYKTGAKGKFAKFTKYYKVAKKIQIDKLKNIQIQIKRQKRIPVIQGKTKSSTQIPSDRFQKFISKKTVHKDLVDQSALQMKQVNEAKILKRQQNIAFMQQLFASEDDQLQEETDIFQRQSQRNGYKTNSNQLIKSTKSSALIQISSDDQCVQLFNSKNDSYQQDPFQNADPYDQIDFYNWEQFDQDHATHQTNQLPQQKKPQEKEKPMHSQIRLISQSFKPTFTTGNNLNSFFQRKTELPKLPILKQQKSVFQYDGLKKTSTCDINQLNQQKQIKKQDKKRPSILQMLQKIEKPKPKMNKKYDFI